MDKVELKKEIKVLVDELESKLNILVESSRKEERYSDVTDYIIDTIYSLERKYHCPPEYKHKD